MNKKRRKRLDEAIALLNQANEIVEEAWESERESFAHLGGSLQQTERGQKMEGALTQLEGAAWNIEVAVECIEDAIL